MDDFGASVGEQMKTEESWTKSMTGSNNLPEGAVLINADTAPEFSFAQGSTMERARILALQMDGASTAISPQALAYVPATEDLFFHSIDDGRYTRRIYKTNDLRDAELKLIAEFKEYVSSRN